MAIRMNSLSLSICSFLVCTPLFASTEAHYKDEANPHSPNHVVISLGGGQAYASKLGDNKTFPPAIVPGNSYAYDFDDEHKSSPFFNAFIGGQWPLMPCLDVQAGLGYYYINSFTAEGTVTQGVDIPSSDEYDVHYHIRSQQLLLDTKWLYSPGRYHPYLSAGVGGAVNTASSFSTAITPPFTTVSRTFEDHNTTNWTYTLGLGLDVDINSMTRIGVGYRYNNLGKVKLGDSSIFGVPQSGTLSQSHVYTNDVIAQLTFII